jgi:hypothetical protein
MCFTLCFTLCFKVMRTPDVDGYEMQSVIIAKNESYYRVTSGRDRDIFDTIALQRPGGRNLIRSGAKGDAVRQADGARAVSRWRSIAVPDSALRIPPRPAGREGGVTARRRASWLWH